MLVKNVFLHRTEDDSSYFLLKSAMRKSNCYLKSQTKVSIVKNGRRPSEDRRKDR